MFTCLLLARAPGLRRSVVFMRGACADSMIKPDVPLQGFKPPSSSSHVHIRYNLPVILPVSKLQPALVLHSGQKWWHVDNKLLFYSSVVKMKAYMRIRITIVLTFFRLISRLTKTSTI